MLVAHTVTTPHERTQNDRSFRVTAVSRVCVFIALVLLYTPLFSQIGSNSTGDAYADISALQIGINGAPEGGVIFLNTTADPIPGIVVNRKKNLTIMEAAGESASITNPAGTGIGIEITESTNIRICAITISNAPTARVRIVDSFRVALWTNHFADSTGPAIKLEGTGSNIIVSHSVISNNDDTAFYMPTGTVYDDITIATNIIIGNTSATYPAAISITNASNVLISSNEIRSNASTLASVLFYESEDITFVNNRMFGENQRGVRFITTHTISLLSNDLLGCLDYSLYGGASLYAEGNFFGSNLGGAPPSAVKMEGAGATNNRFVFNTLLGGAHTQSKGFYFIASAGKSVLLSNTILNASNAIEIENGVTGLHVAYETISNAWSGFRHTYATSAPADVHISNNNFIASRSNDIIFDNTSGIPAIYTNYYGGREGSNVQYEVAGAAMAGITNWAIVPFGQNDDWVPPAIPFPVYVYSNYIASNMFLVIDNTIPGDFAHFNVLRNASPNYSNFSDSDILARGTNTSYTDASTGMNNDAYVVSIVDTNSNEGWYGYAQYVTAIPLTNYRVTALPGDGKVSNRLVMSGITNITVILSNRPFGTNVTNSYAFPYPGVDTNILYDIVVDSYYDIKFISHALNGNVLDSGWQYFDTFAGHIERTYEPFHRVLTLKKIEFSLTLSNVDTFYITNATKGEEVASVVGTMNASGKITNFVCTNTNLGTAQTYEYHTVIVAGGKYETFTNTLKTFDIFVVLDRTNEYLSQTAYGTDIRYTSVTNMLVLFNSNTVTNFTVEQDSTLRLDFSNLLPDAEYQFDIYAYNYGGNLISNTLTFRTLAARVTNLSVVGEPTLGFIRLIWSQTNATRFLLMRKDGQAGFSNLSLVMGGVSNVFDDTTIAENKEYVYRVYSINARGVTNLNFRYGENSFFTNTRSYTVVGDVFTRNLPENTVRPYDSIIRGDEAGFYYNLDVATAINIKVYDRYGRIIRDSFGGYESGTQQRGLGNFKWTLLTERGEPVENGLYIIVIEGRTEEGRWWRSYTKVFVVR